MYLKQKPLINYYRDLISIGFILIFFSLLSCKKFNPRLSNSKDIKCYLIDTLYERMGSNVYNTRLYRQKFVGPCEYSNSNNYKEYLYVDTSDATIDKILFSSTIRTHENIIVSIENDYSFHRSDDILLIDSIIKSISKINNLSECYNNGYFWEYNNYYVTLRYGTFETSNPVDTTITLTYTIFDNGFFDVKDCLSSYYQAECR